MFVRLVEPVYHCLYTENTRYFDKKNKLVFGKTFAVSCAIIEASLNDRSTKGGNLGTGFTGKNKINSAKKVPTGDRSQDLLIIQLCYPDMC